MLNAIAVKEHQQTMAFITPFDSPRLTQSTRLASRPGADQKDSVVLYKIAQKPARDYSLKPHRYPLV